MAELDDNLLQLILKRLDSLDEKVDSFTSDTARHRMCQETTLPELVETVKKHTDELREVAAFQSDLRSVGRFMASVMVIVFAAGILQIFQWSGTLYRHLIGGR